MIEVWQDFSAGKSVVDALLAPTSPHEVGRAESLAAVDKGSMSIYHQMKVGQQNPKKNDDAGRGA